jgi:hypothetical protein
MVSMANSVGVVCLLSKQADVKNMLHTVRYLLKSYSVTNGMTQEEPAATPAKPKRIQLDEIKKMVFTKVRKDLKHYSND